MKSTTTNINQSRVRILFSFVAKKIIQCPVCSGAIHSKLREILWLTSSTEQFNDFRFLAVGYPMNLESKYLVLAWFKFSFEKCVIISIWQFWKLPFKLSSKEIEKNGDNFTSLIKILLKCGAIPNFNTYASLVFPILYFSAISLSGNMAVKTQLLSSHEIREWLLATHSRPNKF